MFAQLRSLGEEAGPTHVHGIRRICPHNHRYLTQCELPNTAKKGQKKRTGYRQHPMGATVVWCVVLETITVKGVVGKRHRCGDPSHTQGNHMQGQLSGNALGG